MDIFTLVDVRIEVIFAIVGIVETLKTIIEKRQLSVYILLTMALSFVFGWGLATEPAFREVILNGLTYFGLASFFYKAVLRVVQKYTEKVKQQIETIHMGEE